WANQPPPCRGDRWLYAEKMDESEVGRYKRLLTDVADALPALGGYDKTVLETSLSDRGCVAGENPDGRPFPEQGLRMLVSYPRIGTDDPNHDFAVSIVVIGRSDDVSAEERARNRPSAESGDQYLVICDDAKPRKWRYAPPVKCL